MGKREPSLNRPSKNRGSDKDPPVLYIPARHLEAAGFYLIRQFLYWRVIFVTAVSVGIRSPLEPEA